MARKLPTLVAALVAILGLGFVSVEPMRWGLPARYLYSTFDIHRSGFKDFQMCMRVSLTEAEAKQFISDRFDKAEQIARKISPEEANCPAQFWPKSFDQPTRGYKQEFESYGAVGYSSGAVYQNGELYFWAWEI